MESPKKPAPTPSEPETTKRPPLHPIPKEAFPSDPGDDILPTDPPPPPPPPKK